MKRLLILGAGTAGTMAANRMRRLLDDDEWKITIVDQHEAHYYQPGFLFIPFGMYSKNDVIKPRRDFIPAGVELVMSAIDAVDADHKRVRLADGRSLPYDFLIIATGAQTYPSRRRAWSTVPGARRSSTSTPSKARWRWRATCARGRAAGWSSTSSRTRSSARWRRSSS
jgi:NADH dehydrogenase FAD-containing subunit